MKKITLADSTAEVINFFARGQRGSKTEVVLVIDSKGIIADDADAALALERLGSNIVVEDIDVKTATKLVADALGASTPIDPAIEEARRAALTDEERAAEDKAIADAKAIEDAKAADKAAKAAAKKAAAKKKVK